MDLIELEQGSEEWHEFRKEHIGASELPIIMGVSKKEWKNTPYKLWQQKMGFVDSQSNSAMGYGTRMEPLIRDRINKDWGRCYVPAVCVHDEYKWASASLDGYDGKLGVICEIKCANFDDHVCAMAQKVPVHYIPQVQWQMFVTGIDSCWYISYHADKGDRVERELPERCPGIEAFLVEADPDHQKELLEAALSFLDCVRNMEAPEYGESDYVPIEGLDYDELAVKYKDVRILSDKYAKEEKQMREEILGFTDDGNCEGAGVRFTRVKRDGSVDWKKLYEDAYMHFKGLHEWKDPDEYRKESIGYWKVSLYD